MNIQKCLFKSVFKYLYNAKDDKFIFYSNANLKFDILRGFGAWIYA